MDAGAVYSVSNDRVLHAMNPTDGGGSWPRGAPFAWFPAAMNGPAQHRPPVVQTTAGLRVFLASQDGYAYAFNAQTGALAWQSAKLGDVLQASPAGFFSTLVPGAPDLLFVGTRNATSANTLFVLDPATGGTLTSFNNGGGANAIGIITGIAVDYATNDVYFTSRSSGTGSSHTLWRIHVSTGPLTLTRVWSLGVGDVDGSPILYQGRVYVGTNTGLVKAIDPAGSGSEAWTYSGASGNGPVKGYVHPHIGLTPPRLYFSTTSNVWAIRDDGGSPTFLWSTPRTGPSTPLYVVGTDQLVVGSTNGTLYQLSAASGSQTGSLALGTGALGAPARDTTNERILVGSTGGVVHSVALPLP
jgi:outer membrane protein assembly factor BamB